ncbi:MAG: hypothetical protein IPJ82_15640 [Lewinellaceae bacterium]|nr:hypothetical protein [Lewinellaceae bacterium]
MKGKRFNPYHSEGRLTVFFEKLAAYNDAHNLLGAAFGTQGKLYHLTTGGDIQYIMDYFSSMDYLGYNPFSGTAFFQADSLWRSPDGGFTWHTVALAPGTNKGIKNLFCEPGGSIWADAGDVFYHSVDDGETWAQVFKKPNTGFFGGFFRADNGTWFTTDACGPYQFSRSTDQGTQWTDLSQQFKHPNVIEIAKDGSGVLYVYTCSNNAFEKSEDGGQTWNEMTIYDSVKDTLLQVRFALVNAAGQIIAQTGFNEYFRSPDGGANWFPVTLPGQVWLSPEGILTDPDGNYYCIYSFSNSFKSTDGGQSWAPINISEPGGVYSARFGFHPNGDIYYYKGAYIFRYIEALDTAVSLTLNSPVYAKQIIVTSNGRIYLTGHDGNLYDRLFRLSSNNQIVESIPFFNGKYIKAMASNAEGDLFVSAMDTLFRTDDGGNSWVNLGRIPNFYDSNNHRLYISPDQYLYLGFNNDVIYRSVEPVSENNFILGKVWIDSDGDCAFDSSELEQVYTIVTATGNSDHNGFSGYAGNFTISVPSGTYVLNVKPPNALYEPCFSDFPATLDGPNDSVYVELPLKTVASCPYLNVRLSTPILRRCFDNTYTIQYQNEGTTDANDAYVEVTLDSLFEFQSSTLPVASQNGTTYTFQIGGLAPWQAGTFKIVVKVSCDAAIGQEHCMAVHIYPDQLCLPSLPSLAACVECRANIGSFDPNDKRAFVNGKEDPGNLLPDTDIEYLIRFQNTGTDTAFRVVVEDRLSALLDLTSITPLVASHPFAMELKDQRTIRFVFDNIMLPDSNINEPASHGFIKFRVSQTPGLPFGYMIRNEADIFFDFNAPVRTNESKLIVGVTTTMPEPGHPYSILAYPNPFDEEIVFEVKGPDLTGIVTLRLFDVLGREVHRKNYGSMNFTLPRNGLENGFYFFLLDSEGLPIGSGKILAN